MNWLHYLLEANIYLAVFYLLYYILLANETHYRMNRIFLLAICIFAYIIPFVQVGFLKPADNGLQTTSFVIKRTVQTVTTPAASYSWPDALIYGYIIGAIITATVFIIKLIRLVSLVNTQKSLLENKYRLVSIENSNTTFSFFNYVFIGTNVAGAETVIRHELVHIKQKHSVDIIFLELIKAISWFNPFIYLLQRSLKSVHEYMADEQAAAFENDPIAYSSLLVNNAYGLGGSSITHSFFNYNLLKKRIIMLNQKRSGNLARLKYLAALPVCAGLLCASTLGFSKTYGIIDITPQKQTDTTKQLKVVEVKKAPEKPVEIRQKVGLAVKEEISKQKKLALKQAQSADKIKEIEIDPVKTNNKSADLIKKLPGTEVTANGDVYAQGKPVTKIKINGKDIKEAKTDVYIDKDQPSVQEQQQKILPPPPPRDPLDSFYTYIGRHVRYPTKAHDAHISGKTIFEFEVVNGKMNNIKLVRGVQPDMDNEALRVLKTYPDVLKLSNGTYGIPITFQVWGKNNKPLEAPTIKKINVGTKSTDLAQGNTVAVSAVHMLNEVVVTTYVN